jgi:uncharacterized membrane protein
MNIEEEITIKAPVSEVFKVFSDLKDIEKRIKGIDSIELLEGTAKMKVGTKWKETRTLYGKEATEVMWVTALRKDQYYRVEADSHGTHYVTNYTFEENDGETLVRMVFSGEAYGRMARYMRLLTKLFDKSVRKALQADLVDLKEHIEQ